MLKPTEIAFVRETLEQAKNPLFFYDGDADGLASFLLLYRFCKEGRGSMVEKSNQFEAQMLRKIEEHQPDVVFLLDIPVISQEFANNVKRPLFWIDHHQPIRLEHVHYYNPRLDDPEAYVPTTRMAYQITTREEDEWIAAIGCLADWYLPDFITQFQQQYPHLLEEKSDLTKAIYEQPIGILVKMFFFLLKGKQVDVKACIKILTRITSPDEILKQTTAQGKFLLKRFQYINEKYLALLLEAKKSVTRSRLVVFYYTENQWSFTSNLANELMALYPEKVILICRRKSGEVKCSLRGKLPIEPILQKSLVGIKGHGGGHQHACGAVVKEDDWERFLENFKQEIKNAVRAEAKV